MWTTGQEFLDLRSGGHEEHAILLCNYFNWIDQKLTKSVTSYLIFGRGIPEGETVYVLRILDDDHKQFEIWNVQEGECYYFEKKMIMTKTLFMEKRSETLNLDKNAPICPLK